MHKAVVGYALGIAFLATVTFAGLRAHDNLTVARTEAASARAATVAAMQQAVIAKNAADKLLVKAAQADSIRRAAETRAAVAERIVGQQRIAFENAVNSAPDTCKTVIAAADSVIATQDSVIADLHQALAADSVQRAFLTFALDTSRAALAGLDKAATVLVAADAKLAGASRRPLLLRLLPRPGFGLSAGVTHDGRPAVLTGITLSWTF